MCNRKSRDKEILSKTMYCTKCGNEIIDDALFCTKCGAPLVKTEPKSKNTVFIGIIIAAILIVVCIGVFGGRALVKREKAGRYEPKEALPVIEYAPPAEEAFPAAEEAAPAADAAEETAAPAAAALPEKDIKELYGKYLYAYMKEYPEQNIVSGSICDIDGDNIADMILLWDKGGNKTEEILTIRTDIGADVISIFNTGVEYFNLSVLESEDGSRFACVKNAKNVDYVIHNKSHEIFGTPASDGRYCMSQRYTDNDRDYEPVSWNEDLFYVYEDEWSDAWDRLLEGTKSIDFEMDDAWIKGSMDDDEISSAFDSFWDYFGIEEGLIDSSSEWDFPEGCIGVVYITTCDPSGLNLHYTPDIDEDSIDYDLGPVGPGYRDGINGDMFYVIDKVEGSNGVQLYLLDNERYLSASRSYTAFVPVD